MWVCVFARVRVRESGFEETLPSDVVSEAVADDEAGVETGTAIKSTKRNERQTRMVWWSVSWCRDRLYGQVVPWSTCETVRSIVARRS